MKVFVTGASGFVGHEVVKQLQQAGHQVRCLIRPGSKAKLAEFSGLEYHSGDTTSPETLSNALDGCDAVVHLVGIIREVPWKGITFKRLHEESTRNMVAAASAQGVKRYLQMSANGTREQAATGYHQTKWAAEEAVRDSSLEWTIFRPSLIYGPEDQFVNMLAGLIRKMPLVPVMGDGCYRLQPVHVEDVATGFVRALEHKESIGQIYACGGPESFSYDELLDLIGRALGREKVGKIHQPLLLMRPAVSLLGKIPAFPMTGDQLKMLLEGNCCNPGPWQDAFNLEQRPFLEGISSYLE